MKKINAKNKDLAEKIAQSIDSEVVEEENGEFSVAYYCKEESETAKYSKDEIYDIIYKCLDQEVRYIYDSIRYLREELYDHKEGHLPKMSFDHLKRALETLGMDDEYELKKKVIYADVGDFAIEVPRY